MTKRLITAFTLLVAFFATAALIPATATAATHHTREGVTVELTTGQLSAKRIPPLDGSPTSAEALLSSDVHAALTGIKDKKVSATLEVGYQIGYPVSIAPGGVKITAHTPDLKLTGGVDAKVNPNVTVSGTGGGGSVGDVGVSLGAESTIIPATDLEFEVAAGKITTVSLAKIALTKPTADIVLSGVELHATNALGPISVRPFTKISVTTETGVYVYYAYGKTSRI
ncbi:MULTISPECIES: MspA family porin [Gordonia]|uniref:Porin MspA n=2 Tax=Gordonia TaxID=2053 RepID=L7LPA2_9ACTN|nr:MULTISPECIES: MspA family porin [Gordonia]AUH67442.1 porin [Gordonia sp. YC-JH1]KJR09137.1 porin [Gordonia sihwensis]KXT55801.1 porin [Gordonia sp. QH-12]MBY4571851.1 porin [Gordonia sihwensis]WFN92914.1 MspA family porin [Gordonia sihwensis]